MEKTYMWIEEQIKTI